MSLYEKCYTSFTLVQSRPPIYDRMVIEDPKGSAFFSPIPWSGVNAPNRARELEFSSPNPWESRGAFSQNLRPIGPYRLIGYVPLKRVREKAWARDTRSPPSAMQRHLLLLSPLSPRQPIATAHTSPSPSSPARPAASATRALAVAAPSRASCSLRRSARGASQV